ncbi:MAG: trypsin-like peptidase domain-containing protein [Bacillota bacterium]
MTKTLKVIVIILGIIAISATSATMALLLPRYFNIDIWGEAPETTAERKEMSIEELAELKAHVATIEAGSSLGSGVVVSSEGYIITNYHVIADSPDKCYAYFEVSEGEFKKKLASLITYDIEYDLALLKLEDNKVHGFIPFGDSDLAKQGQKVVAIGSPHGITNTVSDGIVSGKRNIGGIDYIQTTAPISAGNSGGALLNTKGELIGINTFKIINGENLNFAVSSNNVQEFFNFAINNRDKNYMETIVRKSAKNGKSNPNTVSTGDNDYVLPFSNERHLIDEDIADLSKWELRLARNEIYARHGYMFKNEELIMHFYLKSWYIPNPEFKESDLSEIEKYNIEFIMSYED